MASTKLTRTLSSSNRKTWTWSGWIKKSKLGNVENIFTAGSTSDDAAIRYLSAGNFNFYETESNGATYAFNLETNALYRDVNGWYHLVVAVDTTQATASNRVKMYVNGSQVTFNGSAYPSQDFVGFFNHDFLHQLSGSIHTTYGTREFDGSMSHVHFIDGTAYDASAFGEYDANGVWKIKTSPSVTYGNNGFFILKDGNSVTDQSGNSNNFTVGGGTLTNTEDNPSNVFATWNPLDHRSSNWNMQNGNTRLQGTGGDTWETRRAISTLGASSGKYYAEVKMTTAGTDSYPFGVGYDVFELSYSSSMGSNSNFWGYFQPAGGQIYGGGTGSPLQTSLGGGTGDIIGIALDIDNLTLQFYKNGSTMGSQITGLPSGKTWFFASSGYGNTNTFDTNFGNGYFGTTAVSSAGTNASGIGIFEYDVPTGYTALSTKGLNL